MVPPVSRGPANLTPGPRSPVPPRERPGPAPWPRSVTPNLTHEVPAGSARHCCRKPLHITRDYVPGTLTPRWAATSTTVLQAVKGKNQPRPGASPIMDMSFFMGYEYREETLYSARVFWLADWTLRVVIVSTACGALTSDWTTTDTSQDDRPKVGTYGVTEVHYQLATLLSTHSKRFNGRRISPLLYAVAVTSAHQTRGVPLF